MTDSEFPQQSRQQEIEKLGRRAFEDSVPTKWLVRPVTPDYGVDDQVEIFTPDGSATGRLFLVQNKATDEENLTKALAVRLKLKTVAYLNEQDLPVLIVRYHVPTKTLYAKWFHSFDVRTKETCQKTITYRLTEEDRWSDDTPGALSAEVERWRALRMGNVSYPIDFSLDATSGIGQFSSNELAVILKAAAAKLGDLLRISTDGRGADTTHRIAIDDKVVHINKGSSPTFSFPHSSLDYTRDDGDLLVADLFCSIALWLGQIRQVNAAVHLLSLYCHRSMIVRDPDSLMRVVSLFVRGNDLSGLIDLIALLQDGDDEDQLISDFLKSAIGILHLPSPKHVAEIERFLSDDADKAASGGNMRSAAIARYNYGSFLRANGRREEAIRQYEEAAELDPDYRDRGYFCAELAACLFDAKRMDSALSWCERAIKLEPGPLTSALYADILMFKGRYEEARDAFADYVEEYQGESEPVFLLKLALLNQVVDSVGPTQNRQIEAAQEKAGQFDEATENEVDGLIDEVSQLDALNPSVHYNRAVRLRNEDRIDEARDVMAFAAVLNPGDIEAWVKAALLSFAPKKDGGEERDLSGYFILLAAYRECGQELIDRLRVKFAGDNDTLDALSQLIDAMPLAAPRPSTVRLLGQGASYEVLTGDEDV